MKDMTEEHTPESWANRQWQSLIDDAPVVILVADRAGAIRYSNRTIVGVVPEALVGHSVWDLIAPDRLPQFRSLADRVFSSGHRDTVELAGGGVLAGRWYQASIGPIREADEIIAFSLILNDITDLKQSREAQEASESRYRMLAENASDIILRCTADARLLYISPSCKQLTGYTQAELVGTCALDLIHPEDIGEMSQVLESLTVENDTTRVQCRVIGRDGQAKWIEAVSRLIHSESDGADEIICVVRDISEYHTKLTSLSESEWRFRSIVDSSPMGIHYYYLDENDRLIFDGANRTSDTLLGINSDALVGKTIEEAFPDLAGSEIPAEYRRVALTNDRYRSEKVVYEDERIKGIFEIDAFQIAPRRMAVMFLDITERQLAVDAIRESEEKFREIAELLPIGVYETDETGRLLYVNDKLMEYFGLEPDDLYRGLSILDLFGAEDRTRANANFRRLMNGDRLGNNEYLTRRRNGDKFPARFQSAPIVRGGEIVGIRGVCMDITEEREQAERAHRASKLESVGMLAGGIAHDYNNLLTGILGNISLACQDVPEGSDCLQRLHDAEKAVEQARLLTSQLLTFAKGGDPVRKVVDLKRILSDSIAYAQRRFGVQVKLSCPEQPPRVMADAGQIIQLLNNLLKNAAEAVGHRGTIELSVVEADGTASEATDAPGSQLAGITVSDSGTGMDEMTRQRMFDPYFTTRVGHMGLGLATVHSIVKKHHGYIAVDSHPGEGTQVTVYLPLAEQGAPKAETPVAENRSTEKRKILVMDDEEFIRDLARRILRKHGHDVVCVPDGKAAIDHYVDAQHDGVPFDLVILDLTIPHGMGGKETIARLRKIDPEVIALVCSGYSNDPVLARHEEYGFRGIVTKPYKPADLVEAVSALLTDAAGAC
ncbi:PAS domain S-box protein [candidate division GN15 bacterium]|nr:PAS domain S-box protein [candidate division GN15 bacterium]